jgi:Zn-dependent M28 family amino/carboxypeptidase
MLFRSLVVVSALLFATASAAQDVDLRAQVAAYVQPSNEARTQVVVDQLRAAGFEPTIETFAGGSERSGPIEGRNVVVTIGDGPREILMTAHYDAVRLRDGTMAAGVVDNAASVVGMIEAARILKTRALTHRVRLVLLDQEELGLIGARKWIEAHGLENVAAVVNSDVAGYGDTMMYGQNNGPQSAGITRAVRELCAERAMNCVGYPVYPPSDDRAFSAAGAPVVSLGFQDHVGAHQMWLAFNGGQTTGLAEGFVPKVFATIHTANDNMDAIDPATVRTAGEVYAALVEKLDRQLAE